MTSSTQKVWKNSVILRNSSGRFLHVGSLTFGIIDNLLTIIDPPLGEFVEILPSVMIFPSGQSPSGNIITRVIFHRIPLAPGL
jgi:hypothetical protein